MARLFGSQELGLIVFEKELKKMDLLEVSKLDLVKLTEKDHYAFKFYRKLLENGKYTFEVNRKLKKDLTLEGWELMKQANQNKIPEEFLLKGGEKYE